MYADKVNVPIENVYEPNETAQQPKMDNMKLRLERQTAGNTITFSPDTVNTEKSSSQRSSGYMLSQPGADLSHHQKLLWLQKRRTSGLWVQCDDCLKWRYLSDVLDRYELPKNWFCRMNTDANNADCSVPETPIRIRDEEDLIHSEYSAGSLVWARMPGFPWWPAMVDDCPDTEQFYWLDGFSDIPTHYNVVFFDSVDVTRAWIAPNQLKPYGSYRNTLKTALQNEKKFRSRLRAAMVQADEALKLSLNKKLQKYSFLARYKGNLKTPKRATKNELKRHQKNLKRKFNIEIEINSESDDDIPEQKSPANCKNSIKIDRSKNEKIAITENPVNDNKNVTNAAPENSAFISTEKDTELIVPTNNILKPSNSMAVHIDSDTALMNASFDNDTSKTYAPETESTDGEPTQLTEGSEIVTVPQMRVRIASSNSEDFEF